MMGNKIKIIREERGLTQQQCADRLGISIRTYQRYEKGESDPCEMIRKLAKLFNVTTDEIMEE